MAGGGGRGTLSPSQLYRDFSAYLKRDIGIGVRGIERAAEIAQSVKHGEPKLNSQKPFKKKKKRGVGAQL